MNYEQFKEAYPDYVEPKPIECLDLIMKKQFAQQIINGEKKLEFRALSAHYANRLCDVGVNDFLNAHANDENAQEIFALAQLIRPVKKIHFHNYSNSWHLDVECKSVDSVVCCRPDVEYLNEAFDCHELDKLCDELDARNEEKRPVYYFFECGDVIERFNI
jgi:hypothetical protein